ncbi:hypothetical protein [Vibrio sp. H11]|uniref:hypothetical protein n=1 Tax=Vibrio sp. H11 TaxID=2565928 RepID=UPI0010A66512|nr:hypothetical protein [Vibrio sp. H11]
MESVKLNEALLGDKLHEPPTPSHLTMTLPDILSGSLIVPDYIKDMIVDGVKNDFIRQKCKHSKMNAVELKSISDFIKDKLVNKNYIGLTHKYYSFDEEYPVACSSSFIPYFDSEGKRILTKEQVYSLSNKASENPSDSLNVFLNIFPENGKTHVLFSFFSCNKNFSLSLEELFQQDDCHLKVSLSNIILNYVENIAFKPSYIEDLFTKEEREKIKLGFMNNMIDPNVFTNVNISLFVNRDITSALNGTKTVG